MKKIDRLRKGERPTLLDTDHGNKVIDLCNAVIDCEISPAGSGKVTIKKNKMRIELTAPGTQTLKIRVLANGGIATRNFVIQ